MSFARAVAVTGTGVSFVEMLDIGRNEVPITYTCKLGDFATEEFVAKRAKD